jgi:hypothetical protein
VSPSTVTIRDPSDLAAAVGELQRRKTEALRVWRPMASQTPYLRSRSAIKILRGGVRSGKTVTVACEVAAAATGTQLLDHEGNPVPQIYPTDRPLTIWIIGYDERHISRIYKKLFRPGLFKVIRDQHTGRMRAWNPLDPDDAAREDETEPSPPLIPSRYIDPKGWAWENKAERVFRICRLKNGTELHAFASGGEAAQGDACDIIWIDEDIKIPAHIEEWLSRLSDIRSARLLWSVWPHSSNTALIDLSRRAEEQKDWPLPDVYEQVLWFSNNPYIPQENRQQRIRDWSANSADVARARDKGDFIMDLVLVYPNFNVDLHGLPSAMGMRGQPDLLERFLAERGYQIPFEWTTYLALDPGHTQPAVLFLAVPPPEFGNHVVVYDEVYTPRVDADQLAAEVKPKIQGRFAEAFLIDYRFGRQTASGTGKTFSQIYSEAFARAGLKSRASDSGFIFGSDNIAARNMQVRSWLSVGPEGWPKLRIVRDRTPNLQREFLLYKKRVTKDDVKEEVVDKDNHLLDAMGYLAAFDPTYIEPPEGYAAMQSLAVQAWKKLAGHGRPESEHVWLGAGAVPDAPFSAAL